MAGTVTVTHRSRVPAGRFPVRAVTLAWTSDASGDVSGTLTGYLGGELVRVVFIPGAGGTQPTDLYDATLLDENGLNVLAGQGANLSNATTTNVRPGVPWKDGTTTGVSSVFIDDKLELRIANAGDSKTGTVVLYIR